MKTLREIECLKKELMELSEINRLRIEQVLENFKTPEDIKNEILKEKADEYLGAFFKLSEEERMDDPDLAEMAAFLLCLKGESEKAKSLMREETVLRETFIGEVPRVPEGVRKSQKYKKIIKGKGLEEVLIERIREDKEFRSLKGITEKSAFREKIYSLLLKVFMEDINRFSAIQNNSEIIERIIDKLNKEENEKSV